MEYFIVEDGVERKAKLEDLLPLISETIIQYVLREALRSDIELPYAFVYMADEIKDLVYRNLPLQISRRIEKEIKDIESNNKMANWYINNKRAELISFIEKYKDWISLHDESDRIVWKEKEREKEPPKEKPLTPIEVYLKDIEKACNSGELYLVEYDKNLKDDLQKAFAAFQDRKNELQKIRTLSISGCVLPAAELLFEAGGIEKLEIWFEGSTELPPWLNNAVSLRHLSFEGANPTLIPDWIGDMQSLTELTLEYNNRNLKSLPDSIGNLKNLTKLSIHCSSIEKLPDSIGNLLSLKELILNSNERLTSLPDSMGNLKNLVKLELSFSPLESLPDWIGSLQNLTELSLDGTTIEKLPGWIGNLDNLVELSLEYNKNLKSLPVHIGRLKKLTTLSLCGSAIEKLPDAMANCSSLECVDIRNTRLISLPDFITSIKTLKQSMEVIPKKRSLSYLSFCNSYYTLVETIIRFHEKARREGILALEEELYDLSDGFFKDGIRLVVDGTDGIIIKHILSLKIEREGDHYKKKLMEIATEGILSIQSGDNDAFDNIDFKAALQPEEEREETRFIKRALKISEVSRGEGPLNLEKHLDSNGIVAMDVFEFGLCLMVEYWNYENIDKVLTMLISHETDPVRKNLALAKKDAVRMIYDGDNPRIVKLTLLSHFDDDVTESFLGFDDA